MARRPRRQRRGRRVPGLAAEAVTGHQITFAGADTAWAWCAYDTLFIPDLLGTYARVTSRCPVTGTAVGLTVSPDGVDGLEPAEASISLLAADAPIDDDVRQTLCQYIDFFASLAAAEQWVLGNPVTFWLPVADAFDVARWTNAAVFRRSLQTRNGDEPTRMAGRSAGILRFSEQDRRRSPRQSPPATPAPGW